ncbi:unnamed protein product, partial [Acidithrix sp. C25]
VQKRPVGIFDSGFGGLTVLKAIVDLMPYEDIVYFGDSARYPYGPKSKGEVTSFSLQIVKYLKDLYDVKMVVVACNTASAFALAELERAFDGPIVGMIEPGARSLVSSADGDSIGVIGTLGTISSGAYQERIAQLAPQKHLTCAATPGFVEFVERGEVNSEQLVVLAERLLRPIIDRKVESLLLGCTHYPFIARVISQVVGEETILVSSSEETAFQVRRDLIDGGIDEKDDSFGLIRCITSGDAQDFRRIGKLLLDIDFEDIISHSFESDNP